jgi:hypothetical protein
MGSRTLSLKQIQRFYELCEYIDSRGNAGEYPMDRHEPDSLWLVTGPAFKELRDGIIFYSTGHGWRVRKSPHWKETFNQRFDVWRAYQAGYEWAKWCIETNADCDIGKEYADTMDAGCVWIGENIPSPLPGDFRYLVDAFTAGAIAFRP